MNILDHYKQSHDLRASEDYEVSINDQGTELNAPAPVEGRFFYPEGDAPRPQYEGDMLERTGQALEDVGQTAKSMAVGAGAGMAGLPGDVVALTGGLARLLFPGDEGRIQGATDTITKISEAIGSERFLGLYRDLVNESDMSAEDKQMALDAAETGSFFSLPGAVPVAQAAKRGAKAYAAGAPVRVAERQSGTTLASGVDPTAMIDEIIVGFSKANAVKRVQEIAKARTPEGKVTVDDLHVFFDEAAIKRHGRKLNIVDNPEDYEIVKKDLKDGIRIQSKEDVTGQGWYDEDVRKMFSMFANMPGFQKLKDNETQRVIFSAVLGVTSPGPKVAQNTRAGAAQYLQYLNTGKFSTEAPPPGTAVAGIEKAGFGQYGYPAGLKMLQHLLDTFGEEATADFLLSPHTKGDLIAIRKAAGFKGDTVSGMGGKKDSLHLGAAIFGDKAGKFVLNINGFPATTKDKWFVRTIRRAEGTHADNVAIQRDKKKGTEKTVELGSPRNISERQAMDKMVAELVKDPELSDLNLSEQDAQAILWFREQNLYTDLGVLSRPQTFSEGAELVSGQKDFGILGGDEVKAAIEQGEAQLSGFRGVSRSKRAVRSNRRQQLESLNNRGNKEATSKPYGRDSEQDDGRVRSLVPNSDVQAKYENAGLRMPTVEIKTTDHAPEYFDAIKSAMSQHTHGAQVELKSIEELQGLTMHRTSDGGGFALKPDGDIVAVFNSETAPRGGIYATLQAAIEAGGRKLDAFDTVLPAIYETVGFRPVARVKWNDEFAPKPPFAAKAWDKKTFSQFNNGEPDIILFVYDPQYFGGVDKNSIPLFDDFDEAAKIQNAELDKMGGG